MLTRFIASALFTAVVAGTWDAWWHGVIGRESFWSPPHILLYLSTIAAIAGGLYGWFKTKEKVWRRLAIVLLLVPLSAPFDEIWHRVFGIETPASPIIVWSPPHLALVAAIFASFVMLLPILRRDSESAQRFFGGMTFAAMLSFLLFAVSPLQPLGPYHLLGFLGEFFVGAVFVGTLLAAQRWLPGFGGATLMAITFVFLSAVGFGEQIAPGVIVPPHDHPPSWLNIFSTIVPALFIDLSKKFSMWLRGGVAGLLSSGLLYGFSSFFFQPQFQYGVMDAATAIFAGIVGGITASLFFRWE